MILKWTSIFCVPVFPQCTGIRNFNFGSWARGMPQSLYISTFNLCLCLFSWSFLLFSVFFLFSGLLSSNLFLYFSSFLCSPSVASILHHFTPWEHLSCLTFMFSSNCAFSASLYSLFMCFVPDICFHLSSLKQWQRAALLSAGRLLLSQPQEMHGTVPHRANSTSHLPWLACQEDAESSRLQYDTVYPE